MVLTSRSKLIVVIVAPFLVFGGLELGLRLFGFMNPVVDIPVVIWNSVLDAELRSAEALHATDPQLLWSPRPGALVPGTDDETINAAGYRGPQLLKRKPDGVVRVALLGESAMFGLGLAFEQTAGAQLVELANERGMNVEVLNASVIGYTAWQGNERYVRLVREYDVDVVFAGFGTINEHFPCTTMPDERKLALLRSNDRTLAKLASWLRRNVRLLHLASWMETRLAGEDAMATRQRFLEDAARNRSSAESSEFAWDGERRVSLESFGRAMQAIRDEVREDGADLVMIAMPRGPGVANRYPVIKHYVLALRALEHAIDVPLIDLQARSEAEVASDGDWSAWYLPDDQLHLSAEGNRRLAEAMLAFVEELEGVR